MVIVYSISKMLALPIHESFRLKAKCGAKIQNSSNLFRIRTAKKSKTHLSD